MYQVVLYDKDMTELTRLFVGSNMGSLTYTKELSKAGNASFVIRCSDSKATPANLRPYNRVKIYKGSTVKWFGYISNLQVNLNTITVNCIGMLGFLKKRYVSTGYQPSTTTSTLIALIFSSMNGTYDTGLTVGTNALTNTLNAIEISRNTVFDAVSRVATMSGGAEFEIDTDGAFNIVAQLGSDLSDSVIFRYDAANIIASTIYEFDCEVDGDDMANSVTVIGSSSTSASDTDTTSRDTYGLLQDIKNFSDIGNATTLGDAASAYVEQHKNEFYVPDVTPNPEKVDIDSFDVGDTVSVYIANGFINLDQDHRVVKKTTRVSDSATEAVSVSITPVGVNQLPSTFVDSIIDLDARVRLLEGAI